MNPIYVSAAVCIGGVILYLVSDKPKPETIGRYCFGIGLAAFLLEFGGRVLGFVR
jgi:Na+/phosphate symporter